MQFCYGLLEFFNFKIALWNFPDLPGKVITVCASFTLFCCDWLFLLEFTIDYNSLCYLLKFSMSLWDKIFQNHYWYVTLQEYTPAYMVTITVVSRVVGT